MSKGDGSEGMDVMCVCGARTRGGDGAGEQFGSFLYLVVADDR